MNEVTYIVPKDILLPNEYIITLKKKYDRRKHKSRS